MKTYRTLITIVNGYLPEEAKDYLNAKELRYNVFLTETSLLKTQAYLHGNWGVPMYDIICANLDNITREVLNN